MDNILEHISTVGVAHSLAKSSQQEEIETTYKLGEAYKEVLVNLQEAL